MQFKRQPEKTFILHGFKICKNEQFVSTPSVVTIVSLLNGQVDCQQQSAGLAGLGIIVH